MDQNSIMKSKTKDVSEYELKEKFILGDFVEIDKPIFEGTTVYKEEVS